MAWAWAGQIVRVTGTDTIVEIWSGAERIIVHPRATRAYERLLAPRKWAGLPRGDHRPALEPLGRQREQVVVEARPLSVYDALAEVAR